MHTPIWITCIVGFFAGYGLVGWLEDHTKFSSMQCLVISITTFICFYIISL